MLCACALLGACATSVDRNAPSASAERREGPGPARVIERPVADLSPGQALAPSALGTRVRWSGGIQTIEAREGGRQCFTLLHATFDARQVLQWPRDPQYFVACGPGNYDRKLVAPFTLLSIGGRVLGSQQVVGQPVPVIEIEALYRHSDCVQGSEQSPECYAGELQPERP
ncbi:MULTISPECIES: hypothetical protein [unclassified Variovorax]|uniref:hypothetical protein n=1 Tax=unclassified Variovorax TaxID=663243 RepID=UPI0025759FFF|nr:MULTISPECIES: hypothetical protein [unclassified Variovorax]MDM0089334.1 hypothetical protein [Variovorax sp. J22G40]MDM0147407.1 hypothetical protein [Variovorax sp. J2P1-31]